MSATSATTDAMARDEQGWTRAWPLDRPAVVRVLAGSVALLAIWTLVGLAYTRLLDDGPVGDRDRALSTWLEDHRTTRWDTLTEYGSMMSDTLVKVGLVAVFGATMVIVWRRWHDGVFLALAVIVESSVFALTSVIVDRDRPPVEQLDTIPPSGSFPSGHTAAAVSFYLGLYFVTRWHTERRSRRGVMLTIGIVVPIIVASSRVYRGMHHLSDVIAGYALGVATLLVVQHVVVVGVAELDRRSRSGRPYPAQTRALPMPDRASEPVSPDPLTHHQGVPS